ncbi:hypothetical protein AOC36_10620 [Erysipelothrix larvae]|uniref:Probable membrane transporter protein n=1 Tax=Erysipelothrix larvae TaxID=1514105 RepID=A0A109UHL9_9FIRM|nr:sulfite exporter TauE/SafE family protein [Erysipelothrix larvae]AMC94408.1 hypothetical protein AOC36_10620 [Erysipelothrix larvae]
MTLIYGVVVLIATTLGAMSGMGGGVIIKPALDLIGYHDVQSIGFYSSCAVLAMAIINMIKSFKREKNFDYNTVALISMGSIIGGFLGSKILNLLLMRYGERTVQLSQSILLIIILLLVVILVSTSILSYNFKSKLLVLSIGIVLGMLSAYIGIGGGPLNVAIFCLFFSVDFKTATFYSIATIFFTQISTLITIATTKGLSSFDLIFLFSIIPSACIGGFLGSKLNSLLSSKVLKIVFNCILLLLIVLNLFNIINK